VKVGFYATGSADCSHADLIDQIEYAERSGFDSAWFRERHFHADHEGRNFFSSPLVAAAYAAARTDRIRIGVGARILPLDHPIHVAEDAATVDLISGGRLDFGIARIGENDLYQRGFGTTAAEARRRFEEALDVILRAWTGELPGVPVEPRPVQRPHPPVYLVGISPETLRFGARRGFPLLMAAAQPVPAVTRTQETYYGLLEEAGHDRMAVELPLNRFVYVAETDAEAVDHTRDALDGFINRSGSLIGDFLGVPREQVTHDFLLEEVCIFGSPETCRNRVEELAERVDLRHLILSFNYFTLEHERCRRSMELFVEQVLPDLEDVRCASAVS
jgi:alkanesulfonate monooxygenase SsuD/methylene tetrahydromethanopterin reductase-like flavin-dependent oxidoreductase (luciferase family)